MQGFPAGVGLSVIFKLPVPSKIWVNLDEYWVVSSFCDDFATPATVAIEKASPHLGHSDGGGAGGRESGES